MHALVPSSISKNHQCGFALTRLLIFLQPCVSIGVIFSQVPAMTSSTSVITVEKVSKIVIRKSEPKKKHVAYADMVRNK